MALVLLSRCEAFATRGYQKRPVDEGDTLLPVSKAFGYAGGWSVAEQYLKGFDAEEISNGRDGVVVSRGGHQEAFAATLIG